MFRDSKSILIALAILIGACICFIAAIYIASTSTFQLVVIYSAKTPVENAFFALLTLLLTGTILVARLWAHRTVEMTSGSALLIISVVLLIILFGTPGLAAIALFGKLYLIKRKKAINGSNGI